MNTVLSPQREVKVRSGQREQRAYDDVPLLYFSDWFDKHPRSRVWSWAWWERELQRPHALARGAEAKTRDCFSAVRLGRGGKVVAITAAVFDFDGGTTRRRIERVLGAYRHIGYSTVNHTPDRPRYRVIIQLARDVAPDALDALYEHVEELGLHPDRSCCHATRKFLFPEQREGSGFEFWSHGGAELDFDPPGRGLARPTIEVKPTYVGGKNLAPWRDPAWHQKIIDRFAPPGTSIGQPILSLLRPEQHPSTAFFVTKTKRPILLYKCFHEIEVYVRKGSDVERERRAGAVFTAAELLASEHYGVPTLYADKHQPERAVWGLDLAAQIGAFQPMPVRHRPIDMQHAAVRDWRCDKMKRFLGFYDRVIYLVAIRCTRHGVLAPTPISWRWAGVFGMVSQNTAQEYLRALRIMGLLQIVSKRGQLALWLPVK